MGRPKNNINDANISIDLKFEKSDIGRLNERFSVYKTSLISYSQIANQFHFPKEIIEKKMYQLSMLPVIGLYNGEDFEGHKGNTKPYGCIIPNTARFEEIDGEDYLVCEVAIWSGRYSEANDLSDCNQSMEIVGISASYNSTDKFYEVSDMTFDAVCILGADVAPAFKKARMDVDAQFEDEFEEFKAEFAEFLKDINTEEKEDEKVDEDVKFENSGNHKHSVDIPKHTHSLPQDGNIKLPEKEFEEVKFALSHEAIHERLFKAMNPIDSEGYRSFNYFIVETKNSSFVAMDIENYGTYYRFDYSESDGQVTVDFDSKVEVFAGFMTSAEMVKLDEVKEQANNFEKVSKEFENLSVQYSKVVEESESKDVELVELREFKETTEKESFEKEKEANRVEIANIVEKFSKRLTHDEIIDAIGENYEDMNADEVNSKLSIAFSTKTLNEDKTIQQPKVFSNIGDIQPKDMSITDRLLNEAKALKNKNIK